METVAHFVSRTRGPAVPFVPGCYPWAYAHHYLRAELGDVPDELKPAGVSLSVAGAAELIERWCSVTGEGVEPAARLLADAYLERWGLRPPARAVTQAAEKPPGRQVASTPLPGEVDALPTGSVEAVLPLRVR